MIAAAPLHLMQQYRAYNRHGHTSALIRIKCAFDWDQTKSAASTQNAHLNKGILIRINRKRTGEKGQNGWFVLVSHGDHSTAKICEGTSVYSTNWMALEGTGQIASVCSRILLHWSSYRHGRGAGSKYRILLPPTGR